MKNQIYIFVRGGVVQGVRASDPAVEVHLIDYDNYECDLAMDGQTEAEFEREACGKTFEEIEASTGGVF